MEGGLGSASGSSGVDDERALSDALEHLNKAWVDGGRLIKASERIVSMAEWADPATKTKRMDQLLSELLVQIAAIEAQHSQTGFLCKYRRDNQGWPKKKLKKTCFLFLLFLLFVCFFL